VGVEPTRDTKCRTTGFEDQAQHRPRLASSRDSNIQFIAHNARPADLLLSVRTADRAVRSLIAHNIPVR
jgi:hypothetical protein